MKKLTCNSESLTFLPQRRAEHLLACLLNAVMIFEYFFAFERKCNLSFSKLANAESVSGLIKRNISNSDISLEGTHLLLLYMDTR